MKSPKSGSGCLARRHRSRRNRFCLSLALKLLFRQAQPIFRLGHPKRSVSRLTLCELSAKCSPQLELEPSGHCRAPCLRADFSRGKPTTRTFSGLLPSWPLSHGAVRLNEPSPAAQNSGHFPLFSGAARHRVFEIGREAKNHLPGMLGPGVSDCQLRPALQRRGTVPRFSVSWLSGARLE